MGKHDTAFILYGYINTASVRGYISSPTLRNHGMV